MMHQDERGPRNIAPASRDVPFESPWDTQFAYTIRYPIPPAPQLDQHSSSNTERNLRNSPGNSVRTSAAKIVARYTIGALQIATQLVLLGAGFDMRAFRLRSAIHARTFELDHPETSHSKQAMLRSARREVPEHIRYIGMDFNSQSIAEVLLHAGFDNSRPACLIWEGVTNYLTAEAVDRSLRQIREVAAHGSILLFTYIDRAVLDNPEKFFGARKLIERLRSYGEPWTFGLDPGEIGSYLATRRFELLKDVSASAVWQRAGRSRAEPHGYEFYRLASARVGD